MSADPIETARRVAGDGYEILGELGREGESSIAYLARESDTGQLVAVTLEGLQEAAARGVKPGFSVRRSLDPLIPAVESDCPNCDATVATWSRFCPSCGHDLAGTTEGSETDTAAQAAAKAATTGKFDLLGEMSRAEGGAPVYFAREHDTGRIVALRIDTATETGTRKTPTASVTQRLPSLASGSEPSATFVSEPSAASDSAPTAETEAQSAPEPLSTSPEPGARVNICPTCETVYAAGTFFCPRDGTALKPKTQGHDMVGRTIAHRYRIVERLGQGGMGQVYKAIHVRMGSNCAIKIMNPALETDPEALGRFAREAAHASRISHANIARVYDFGETQDGLLFIAMEFAEGDPLSTVISRDGALEPGRAAEIARQVADALAAAHDLGTIHRDIKPDNIIIRRSRTGEENAKVIDFGIAKAVDAKGAEQVTRAGFVVGNPKYMSPEQLIGEQIDERSDIYSLGCVLYEMLVGEAAFAGTTGTALLTRRLTEPPPSPREQVESVPTELDTVVVRALARDKDDRFDSALAMQDALEDYLDTVTTGSRRSTGRRAAAPQPEGELPETPTDEAVAPVAAESPTAEPEADIADASAESATETPQAEAAPVVETPPESDVEPEPSAPSTKEPAMAAPEEEPTPVVNIPADLAAAPPETETERPKAVTPDVVEPPPPPPPKRRTPRKEPKQAEAKKVRPAKPKRKPERRVETTTPVKPTEEPREDLLAALWGRVNTWPGRAAAAVLLIAAIAYAVWPTPSPPPQPGTIEILGDLPAGFLVTASDDEGEEARFSEASFSLPVGSYTLVFEAPGYEVDSTYVVVEAGMSSPWYPSLAESPPPELLGHIRLGVDLPAGGRAVARDEEGQEIELGRDSVELPVGSYVLVFDAQGYERYEEEIQLAAGDVVNWEPERRQLQVEPTTGTVRITGDLQPDAVITARASDGSIDRVRGRTITLEAGEWTLEASAAGFLTYTEPVRVVAGGSHTWTPNWVREPLRPATVDSVRNMISEARAAAGLPPENRPLDYPRSFDFFGRTRTRITALLGLYPGDDSLEALDRRLRIVWDSVYDQCMALAKYERDQGRTAPTCEPARTP